MFCSTNNRVPALQICPELANTAIAAPGTAASRSASANTMSGDLPPSSSDTRLRLPADALTIDCPVTCEPVKATLSTPGCEASAAPAVSPYPGTTLTTPGRNASFHRQLAKPQRRQRRFFRGLKDHRATGSDGGTDLPDAGTKRAVPWNDGADDADGFLQRVGENIAGQRILDGLAMQRGRLPCVISGHAEHPQLVAAGAADRRAHVERVELRQLLEVFLDQIGELEQQGLPLIRLDLAPGSLEGTAGCCDRAVDILGIAFGHRCEQFAGGRIVGLESLAGRRVDPFAVDQHLFVGTVRIRMARNRNRLRHSHVCTPLVSIGPPIVISNDIYRSRYPVKHARGARGGAERGPPMSFHMVVIW